MGKILAGAFGQHRVTLSQFRAIYGRRPVHVWALTDVRPHPAD